MRSAFPIVSEVLVPQYPPGDAGFLAQGDAGSGLAGGSLPDTPGLVFVTPGCRAVFFQDIVMGGQDRIGWRVHIAEQDGMKTYIGIDVSFASSAVCVLDDLGQVVKREQIDSEPEALISFLRDLTGPVEAIGLQAGPLSQWGVVAEGEPEV
ncbi:hypothetical protein [Mangrovicoccus ximenensis]|uniref:hypothetical protein n=1 Tax=Mangrovicoccus ximenensis TaxID=1911570 RepID=UPI00191BFEE4|nr:hypothetical protein [Mangrovicoccus ximenensis]